ncbi:hypothetical protein tloyanaT_04000 [Thalassotalea loyana]|uniref:Uncharacterized protein n=1 Tax=Thalassotalea loyana TaxID=280483 RepID=A0ABQ6H7N0_9GAMM|nr:hypothetical protein [Thalassotalea loyana]GLX84148.1 hypothetical protein tloyanaT_04000 [Thalassotalea loyana]
MGKGLGKNQIGLLELLENSNDFYSGNKIVKYSVAKEKTDLLDSAVSRALKQLENRKLIKIISIGKKSQESIKLPVKGKKVLKTKVSNSVVGNSFKAYTYFDSPLKRENWEIISQKNRSAKLHEKVLLSLKRLRHVHFVFEDVYESSEQLERYDEKYFKYKIQSDRVLKAPKGKKVGKAIPIKYLTLESGVRNHDLRPCLKELEQFGWVKLVYSTTFYLRDDIQEIIGIY